MARLCAGVMAFVLLFRANRLLVSAKAQVGTHQHQVCCRFALAGESQLGPWARQWLEGSSQMAAVAPVGRRAYGHSGR